MNQRHIAPCFLVAIAAAIGFCVTYGLGGQAQLEGVFLALSLGGIGTGMILWAKHFFPNDEVEQTRPKLESTPEQQEEFAETIGATGEDVSRRKFLSRLGLTAIGGLGIAAIFPLKSLGPNPGDELFHTDWTPGARLVDIEGNPYKADQLTVGSIVTVWPEGKKHHEYSATLLIKVPGSSFMARKGRETWAPQGNVAYSKICTHVGCPVGLYRENTHQLLCPCHQSTFDVLDGARPVFGPASRSLPQLPLEVNEEGYLCAQSDYREPVGGGFWDRDKYKDENKDVLA